jgi:hypothetical protein
MYHQILSWANPYKRKRLPVDFDELFDELIANLKRRRGKARRNNSRGRRGRSLKIHSQVPSLSTISPAHLRGGKI